MTRKKRIEILNKIIKESERKLTSKPSSEKTLRDWFARKGTEGGTGGWIDCNTCKKDKKTGKMKCKPCGRQKGETRSKYPACRPTPGACKKYKKTKGKSWGKKSKKRADEIISIFKKNAASKVQWKNLGYPDIIADVFIEKFGEKNSFIVARWFKDINDTGNLPGNTDIGFFKYLAPFGQSESFYYMVIALENARKGLEEYNQWVDKEGGEEGYSKFYNKGDLESLIVNLEIIIKDDASRSKFFDKDLIKEILNEEVKNISQYKNLHYFDAVDKYMQHKIRSEMPSLKEYDDGYRWVDFGKRSDYIRKHMKNCGSAGFGTGQLACDATMLTLIDANNKPHAIMAYSPSEKTVASIEGPGSTELKEEYHYYVLDFMKEFDIKLVRSDLLKSKELALKIAFIDLGTETSIEEEDLFFPILRININDQNFFIAADYVLNEDDYFKLKESANKKQILKLSNIFSNSSERKMYQEKLNIKFMYIKSFEKKIREEEMKKESNRIKTIKTMFLKTAGASKELIYHIENDISVIDNVYRPSSDQYFNLIREARGYSNNLLKLSEIDREIIDTDIGKFAFYNGEKVPLDFPFPDIEIEKVAATYKGKKVNLNRPARGGSKKFYVYVMCGGKVKKISFGSKGMPLRVSEPDRRKSFVARHKCKEKKDKCTAGYWACRIGRYPHLTGAKSKYTWW